MIAFLTIFITVGQEALDNSGNPRNSVDVVKLRNAPIYEKSATNTATVINVIPSPNLSTSSINDIAFDGEYLWVEGYNEYFLHQISPIDGSIINSIPTSVQRPYGLTFDGTNLWLADADNKIIQRIDTANGDVLQSFPTPAVSSTSYPGGLAWDGENLWHNDMMGILGNPDDSTYKLNTAGEILQSYHAFGTYTEGLAWDGQYLWSTDNINGEIYKIDVSTFTVVDTIDAPGGAYPNGLTFDGQYLWLANNSSDSLYQIDIDYFASGVNNLTPTQNELTIYPNPASNEITIISEQIVINNINIININGKSVKSFNQNKRKINVADLANGIYFIQFYTDEKIINKKFIKQ